MHVIKKNSAAYMNLSHTFKQIYTHTYTHEIRIVSGLVTGIRFEYEKKNKPQTQKFHSAFLRLPKYVCELFKIMEIA